MLGHLVLPRAMCNYVNATKSTRKVRTCSTKSTPRTPWLSSMYVRNDCTVHVVSRVADLREGQEVESLSRGTLQDTCFKLGTFETIKRNPQWSPTITRGRHGFSQYYGRCVIFQGLCHVLCALPSQRQWGRGRGGCFQTIGSNNSTAV